MNYQVESGASVELNTEGEPYLVPSDPLALVLEFVPSSGFPPLPWLTPDLSIEYRARFSKSGEANSEALVPLKGGERVDHHAGLRYGNGVSAWCETPLRFAATERKDSSPALPWLGATAVYGVGALPWSASVSIDARKAFRWQGAVGNDRAGFSLPWVMKTRERDSTKGGAWFSVSLSGSVYPAAKFFTDYLNDDTATTVTLNGDPGLYLPSHDPLETHLSINTVEPEALIRPSVPHDVPYRITARQASPRDTNKHLPWGAGQSVWHDYNLPYPVEPNPAPDPVDPPEIKTVYLIMNTLQITDVATGTPLDIQGVTIGLDIDSWAWKFSGTLYGQGSLALVAPGAGGMKDVAVTINGHSWVFSIERYTSDERFPTEKFTITGVSRTQYMAAPFAPTRSYTNASATTAAQAATAELQNTGFSLTWPTGNDEDLPDWPIPAGALSFRDKSPAQVVAQIVTAAGGIMVPAMAADSWTVQPRYKVAPWDWETATPDVGIYIGMVRSRSAQYEPAPAFNACYVSGVSQGVAVDVQRAGSGGTAPMPDIYEDLITDSQPAISRGTAELAGAGNKVVETLSVLIPESGAAPGVLLPGMIVKVMHDDPLLDYMALVLAVSISVQKAGGAEIYQSVTLERSA